MSDIFIKTGSQGSTGWRKMSNLFVKTSSQGNTGWRSAAGIWIRQAANWLKVWPLSGVFSTRNPWIGIDSTTLYADRLTSSNVIRVGSNYYGNNAQWDANGWTITGYSYQWRRYASGIWTDIIDSGTGSGWTSGGSGQDLLPTSIWTAANSSLLDNSYLSFYVAATASNSTYSGNSESTKILVVRRPPINTTASLSSYSPQVGTLISYSSAWNTTEAYKPDASRTTVKWYRNSTYSTTGGTLVSSGSYSYTPVAADLNNYLYVVETTYNSGSDYDYGSTVGVEAKVITTSTVSQALTAPTSVSLNSVSRASNTTTTASISFSGGSGPYYQLYWTSVNPAPVTASYDAASTGSPITETQGFGNNITYYFYVRSSTENLGNTTVSGSGTAGTYSPYSTAYASYTFQSPSGGSASISGSTSTGSTLTLSTSNPTTAAPSASITAINWRVADGGVGGNSFTGGSVLQSSGSSFVIPATMYGTSTVGYQLRAEVTWNNGVGSQTANSNSIVVTSSAPGTPTSLSATTTRTDGVNLTFSGSTNATSYDIFWNTTPSSTPSSAATPDFSSVSSPYLDTTISSGATRYYWVRGKNSSGVTSAWYPAVTGVTGTRLTAVTKLSTPTGVSATTTRTDGVNITWNAVSGASYYGIWWGGVPGYDNAPDFPNITGTSYLDTGISVGSSRTYYVQAYASGNPTGSKSDYSSGATGTRASAPVVTIPATPTGVGLTGSGSVSWTASSGATSYEIEFYTASNGSGSNAAGPYYATGISSSPYQLTSPYGGTNANWARVRVLARNSAGASSYSGWVPSETSYT